jgi:hypothetical protein
MMPMSDDARTTDALQEAANRHDRITRELSDVLAARYGEDIGLYLHAVLADVPAMAAEISRQGTDLARARLNRANLAAAALAAFAAASEGEPDALSYLRDELHAQGHDADDPWSRL